MNEAPKITKRSMDAILEFLPVFEAMDGQFGKWVMKEGVLPYTELDSNVAAFNKALYDNGWCYPFDWSAWGRRNGRKYVENPEKLKTARIGTLQKLFTAHSRQDRFCDGHLLGVLESGHMTAMLRRVKELRDKMRDD